MQRILWPTAVLSAFIACSSQPPVERGVGSGASDGSGASGGTVNLGGSSSVNVGGLGGNNLPALAGMIVSDSGGEITVSGEPASVSFTVELDDGSTAEGVIWTVDDTRIGSIGDDGVFHADGYVGGLVKITAQVNGAEATFDLIVNVDIIENPGSVSDADQAALAGGGTGDAAFTVLYPYSGTVFPRGLSAPVMQYAGTAATQSYTLISAPYFRYQQFAGASTPTRITLPEPVWRGLTLTMVNNDPVEVSVSKSSGGTVTGPVTTNWIVAPGQLKGMFYYSTYKSPLAMETNDVEQGAIMRLRPGGGAEVVQGGCTVCHTVSAQGNVLATGLKYAVAGADPAPEYLNPVDSSTFDLTPDGQMTPRMQSTEGRMFAFAGLSPDGALALTNGVTPDGTNGYGWPPYVPHGVRAQMGYPSELVDTSTATAIDSPSLAAFVTYAQSPVFSPDGQHVAFLNGDMLPARVLSVMDFDGVSVFSNGVDVATTANRAIAWPSFLPDGMGVVYHEGDSFDSSGFVADALATSTAQTGNLRLVNLADQSISTMNLANGYDASDVSYLPMDGAVDNADMNYEPSVLPIAVGGYYWVLFTSRRTYGNTIAPGSEYANAEHDPWGTASEPSWRKKIWIAAIDVDYAGKVDATHPAFYLPGQEVQSGNMRAFAALAPCKDDGETCESGADCCKGFCRETSRTPEGLPVRQCIPPPVDTCSLIDELCETAADCCNPDSTLCINGRCALPPPK